MALNLGGIDKVLLDKISKLPTFALVALAIVFISSATGVATLSVSTTTTSVNLDIHAFGLFLIVVLTIPAIRNCYEAHVDKRFPH